MWPPELNGERLSQQPGVCVSFCVPSPTHHLPKHVEIQEVAGPNYTNPFTFSMLNL